MAEKANPLLSIGWLPAICAATVNTSLAFVSGPIMPFAEATGYLIVYPGVAGGVIDPTPVTAAYGQFGNLAQQIYDSSGEVCWILGPPLVTSCCGFCPGMGATAAKAKESKWPVNGYSVAGGCDSQNALVAHTLAYQDLDSGVGIKRVIFRCPEVYDKSSFLKAVTHFNFPFDVELSAEVEVIWELQPGNLDQALEFFRRIDGLNEGLTKEGNEIRAKNFIITPTIPQIWTVRLVTS